MKYRKKPVVIDAMLLGQENGGDIARWIKVEGGDAYTDTRGLIVRTLEGDLLARWGDYVIRGVQGEFYPCKPDIFAATYDKAE